MVPKLDAGPSILQLTTDIVEDETYGELALRLSELGATALIESLALLELGKVREEPQDDSQATYAPKVDRASTRVNWNQDARTVSRTIRAYDPRPGAFTTLESGGAQESRDVKLFGARLAPKSESSAAGEVISVGDDGLVVACAEGAVRIAQVQPAGKKRISASEWSRGRGAAVGAKFERLSS
jgi:methionyl-tRNA formyltransferase